MEAPGMFRLFGGGLLQPPPIRLEGDRTLLRPPQIRDWSAWAKVREESRAFLEPWEPSWPADSLSRAAFQRRLRRTAQEWRDDDGYGFLIFERQEGRLAGGITLSNVRRGVAQMGTVGYWIGARHARRGLTSEATALLLDFAFGQLGLHRVDRPSEQGGLPPRRARTRVPSHRRGVAGPPALRDPQGRVAGGATGVGDAPRPSLPLDTHCRPA
jgi:[ribosomal protein S5]-alanine N-acetyltransferase